jgi:hypothetical protein
MKVNFATASFLLIIVFVSVFAGSFKRRIEGFENNDEFTEVEKEFIKELQNTDSTKIMSLVKEKNITKEQIDKIIDILSRQENEKIPEEPVSDLPEKTSIDNV